MQGRELHLPLKPRLSRAEIQFVQLSCPQKYFTVDNDFLRNQRLLLIIFCPFQSFNVEFVKEVNGNN